MGCPACWYPWCPSTAVYMSQFSCISSSGWLSKVVTLRWFHILWGGRDKTSCWWYAALCWFATQPLFWVILPICVSIYLCLLAQVLPLQTAGQPPDAKHSVETVLSVQVYIIYFPVHCVGVNNISPHYNLSPTMKIYSQRWHMRFSTASQKHYQVVRIKFYVLKDIWSLFIFNSSETLSNKCSCNIHILFIGSYYHGGVTVIKFSSTVWEQVWMEVVCQQISHAFCI